ncbi:MAG: hypothetical protein V3U78_02560 [Thiotrichaceae bacterium]
MKSNYYYKFIITPLVGVAALVLSPLLYAALPNGNSIPLTLADNTQVTISIKNNHVVALLHNNSEQVLINNFMSIPEYARDIWITDFDFDGRQDVAITHHVDPASHDQFYTIFTWEHSLKHFVPHHFSGGLSNLEVEPARKQIRSSYQAGEFWTEDTYRFINKQPFLYSKSVLVASNLWHTTVYNQQHQILRSLVSNNGKVDRPPHPVILTVRNNTVPLYGQPLPSTRLKEQLNHGSVITIVDFKRGSGQLYWVNIRTNLNNKILQGWTLLSNLVQG